MPDREKRVHNPSYLLNRPGLIPTGTLLRLRWERSTAEYAHILDAWLDASPDTRRSITFDANGDHTGYLSWGFDASKLFSGAALIRRIVDEAGQSAISDNRSGRSFESTAYLLLPEAEPFFGLCMRDYALALRHADRHPAASREH